MQAEFSYSSVQAKEEAVAVKVTRQEWLFVLATALVVLAVTTLPYLYAYGSAPPDKQFMGVIYNIPDHMQYFSWFREFGASNLAANKLTPEPNAPIFFNLLWWGMARIGGVLGIGYAGMYQLLRWVATILFLLLVYRMVSWFFADRLRRMTAFLLILFGAGFGWVLIVMKYTVTNGELIWPLDVYVAEPNTFFSILGSPHFVAAALYMFVFDLVLRGHTKNQLRYAVYAGLFALFMGWQHAYDLLIVYGVVGAYALLVWLRDRRLPVYLVWSGLIIGVISVWPALYSVWLTSLDPLWKEVLKQFANAGVYTPPLYRLPILLGLPFLLALFTALRQNPFRLRGVSNNDLFVRGWFWISFVLIYLPVDYQIHMLNGWQVPIAILATQGIFAYIVPALARRFKPDKAPTHRLALTTATAIIVFSALTNIYLLGWRFLDLSRHDYPFYLYRDEVAALRWLEANATGEDVVLSALAIGQYVPAETGAHAFLAHWAQTVDYYGKEAAVAHFFDAAATDRERQQLMTDFDVDYVVDGPAEQALGAFRLEGNPYFRRLFTSGQVSVYAPVRQ
ncbi:MAG TPA: hypothetical protein DCL15_19420 [Chloroflexi bacterium]|nr:hypothetical protein [Chloroflexota bacterium]HHW87549.1 hypothetical protein [Chloroflexota bacterium]